MNDDPARLLRIVLRDLLSVKRLIAHVVGELSRMECTMNIEVNETRKKRLAMRKQSMGDGRIK